MDQKSVTREISERAKALEAKISQINETEEVEFEISNKNGSTGTIQHVDIVI